MPTQEELERIKKQIDEVAQAEAAAEGTVSKTPEDVLPHSIRRRLEYERKGPMRTFGPKWDQLAPYDKVERIRTLLMGVTSGVMEEELTRQEVNEGLK